MIRLHRSGGGKKPSIQISPMIDMVFLLLIFFIVCTMYMTQQKGVSVELPEGRGSLQQKAELEVTLPKDGTIWFQDHPVTVEALVQEAATEAVKDPGRTVTVRADKEISYGRVMGILGELKRAGLKDFSLSVSAGENHGKI